VRIRTIYGQGPLGRRVLAPAGTRDRQTGLHGAVPEVQAGAPQEVAGVGCMLPTGLRRVDGLQDAAGARDPRLRHGLTSWPQTRTSARSRWARRRTAVRSSRVTAECMTGIVRSRTRGSPTGGRCLCRSARRARSSGSPSAARVTPQLAAQNCPRAPLGELVSLPRRNLRPRCR